MFHHLRTRIILAFFILLVLVLAMSGFLVVQGMENYFMSNVEDSLLSQAKVSTRFANQYILFRKQMGLVSSLDELGEPLANELAESLKRRIKVVSIDGYLVGDSQAEITSKKKYNPREVEAALKGRRAYYLYEDKKTGKRKINFATPVEIDDKVTGAIVFSYSLEWVDDSLAEIQRVLLAVGFISLLIAGLAGWYLSYTITAPLRGLRDAAKRLAEGNSDAYIQLKSADEIGDLARSFNEMAKELTEKMDQLQLEKSKMTTALSSMTDGLIALDSEGKVVLANKVAEDLFRKEEASIISAGIENVTASQTLVAAFLKVLSSGEVVAKELTLHGKPEHILWVYIAPIKGADGAREGAVGVFRDITQLRQLQRLQSQFVSNVSHELRTPLTAIQGFANLLRESGRSEEKVWKKSLGLLSKETNRLSRLVNDLLQLSKLESSKLKLNKKSFSVSTLVTQTVKQLESRAGRYKLALEVKKPRGKVYVLADEDRVKQVLINLIDNAIKFTPAGGKIVAIVEEKDDQVQVAIQDSGPGIPAQDLPHIFDRFYRGKQALLKDTGGSGLGLAIVKEIVEAHDGSIEAESEEGKGTTIVITLPKLSK